MLQVKFWNIIICFLHMCTGFSALNSNVGSICVSLISVCFQVTFFFCGYWRYLLLIVKTLTHPTARAIQQIWENPIYQSPCAPLLDKILLIRYIAISGISGTYLLYARFMVGEGNIPIPVVGTFMSLILFEVQSNDFIDSTAHKNLICVSLNDRVSNSPPKVSETVSLIFIFLGILHNNNFCFWDACDVVGAIKDTVCPIRGTAATNLAIMWACIEKSFWLVCN